MNYYIYYRIALKPEEWVARVNAMHAALADETGIRAQLLRQIEEADTWMEIYDGVTDSARFEAALARLVAEHQLYEGLQEGTQRHVERFEPV
jgi:hypothetical protein